jgi:hypothetical protein
MSAGLLLMSDAPAGDEAVSAHMHVTPEVRAAFQAFLDRQPEWKVREALESGDIPSWHRRDALHWLEQRSEQARRQRP